MRYDFTNKLCTDNFLNITYSFDITTRIFNLLANSEFLFHIIPFSV